MTEETAITQFMSNPHELVRYIRKTGDFEEGFRYVSVIHEVYRMFDHTLDIVLTGMEELFELMQPEEYKGMTFYEATKRNTPLSSSTIQRHTRVGKMLEVVPEKFRPRIENMDFKSKIYIASLVEDKVEVTDEQMERIVEEPSYQGVAKEIHKVRGTEPRSQWCYFQYDADGTVWANTADGEFVYFRPEKYENPEIAKRMAWVHEKALRKMGATPK